MAEKSIEIFNIPTNPEDSLDQILSDLVGSKENVNLKPAAQNSRQNLDLVKEIKVEVPNTAKNAEASKVVLVDTPSKLPNPDVTLEDLQAQLEDFKAQLDALKKSKTLKTDTKVAADLTNSAWNSNLLLGLVALGGLGIAAAAAGGGGGDGAPANNCDATVSTGALTDPNTNSRTSALGGLEYCTVTYTATPSYSTFPLVDFNDLNIQTLVTSKNNTSSLIIEHAYGSFSHIFVTAGLANSVATLDMALTGLIGYHGSGSIVVTASEVGAIASAEIDNASIQLNNIDVIASSQDSTAALDLINVNGSVRDILIDSDSVNATASLYIEGTIEVKDTINVNAGIDSDAVLTMSGDITGNLDSIKLSASSDALAEVTLNHADLSITSGIYVSAHGDNSTASLAIDGSVSLSTADLVVDADGSSALASIDINSVYGSINDLSVYADNSADVSISLDVASGDTLSITNRIDVSAGLNANALAYISGDGSVRLDGVDISVRAEDGGYAGLSFDSNLAIATMDTNVTGNIDDIQVTADGGSAYASLLGSLNITGSIQVSSENDGSASLYLGGSVDLQNTNIEVCADVDASSYLYINNIVDDSDINRIDVEVDGDNGIAELHLSSYGNNLSINGNINVVASGSSAFASLSIDLDGGSTQFGGGDISVVAAGVDSSAFADLYSADAYGSVNLISVVANSDDAYASLHIDTESGHDIVVNSGIYVSAHGDSSSASLDVYGSIDLNDADLYVKADGLDASASVYIDNLSGTVDDISLNVNGLNSSAKLHIGDAQGILSSIYLSNVESDAEDAEIVLSISSDPGHSLTIQDGISIDAWALGSQVSVALDNIDFDGARISLDAANNVGSGPTSSFISLMINDAQGTLSSIHLHTLAGSGVSSAYIDSDGGHSVVIQDGIVLQANSVDDIAALTIDSPDFDTASVSLIAQDDASTVLGASDAQGTIRDIHLSAQDRAYVSASIGSDVGHSVTIQDSIRLEADGESAWISLDIDDVYYDGADISIDVAGSAAQAYFYDDAQGVIDSISMRVNGNDGYAQAYIYAGDTESVSIVDGVSIIVEGENAFASLYIEDVQFDGSSLSLMTGSDIYLTASGIDSSAILSIDYAQGTLDNIRVLANQDSSDASAYINGDISLQNLSDISLTTNNFDNASVSLAINGLTIEDASDLSMYTNGTSAYTNLNIDDLNINFNSNEIHVGADGEFAESHLTLIDNNETSSGLGLVSGITVNALGLEASAIVSINGTIDLAGSIQVSSENDGGASVYLSGCVDLQDISIEVSADANASSYLYIDNIVDDSDINRIDVEVDGDNGIAELYLSSDGNDLSINGDISVLASGSTALASLSIDLAGGSLFLDGDDISVVASSVDSSAFANLHDADAYGSVNLISVVANSDDAYASLHIDTLSGDDIVVNTGIYVSAYGDNSSASLYVNGSIDLNSADLVVDADGSGALASIEINSVYGSINDLSVYADNSADVSISLDVVSGNTLSITNRIDVSAGLDANALAYISGDGSVRLDGVDISVRAEDGGYASLGFNSINISADIDTIEVSADGGSAYANLSGSLNITGSIQVSSENDGSASLYLGGSVDLQNISIDVCADANASSYLYIDNIVDDSDINRIDVEVDGDNGIAELYLSSDGNDLSINGNINVVASGSAAFASLSIDLNGGSLFLDGDDISVVASSVDSSAFVELYDAYGSVNLISVVANSDDAYARAFIGGSLTINSMLDISLDISNYQNASVSLGLEDISITNQDGDEFFWNVSADDAYKALDIDHLGFDYSGVMNLLATGENSTVSLYLGEDRLNGLSFDANITEISVVASGLDSSAFLDISGSLDISNANVSVSASEDAAASAVIENINDESDINRISVEVDGDNGIAELYLSSDGNDLSINGEISVLASGSAALASLSIDLAGGSLFLDGDDISVVASSVDSSAFANLHDADAYGSVNLISVVANSDDAYASLHIDTLSGDDIVVNTGIYVSAYGDNSSASLYVNGSIDLNSADLVVDADGSGALASIEINSVYGSINDLSVYADNSADASISLDVVSGNTLSITNRIDVSAGLDANASLYLGGSVDLQNISIEVSADANASSYLYIDNIVDDSDINRIDVEVDGDNGIAELYLSSDGNDLSINGDISVLASGSTALASLSIDLAGGSLFLDGDDISVVASSVDSSAFANLHDADAYGSVNLISVVANSDDAYASLHIDTLSGDDIVVNTGIYVSAYGDNSSASLYVNGSIDLNSADLVVDADGSGALASIEINSVYGSINDLSVYADNSADASISLDVVSGNTLSITNRIDVSAGLDANASLYLGGSVDLQNISIEVSADANASSYLYIDNIVDDSDINRIDVEVDGDNGIAELYLSSDGNDLSINGDISVLASGSTALASLSIDLAGGSLFLDGDDISVVASSVDSSAFANLHDADAYGSVNLISVVANSDDAYASLHIDTLSGDDIVVNTGIYVSAYGDNSSASLYVNGSIDLNSADLVVDADGSGALASIEINSVYGSINDLSVYADNSADASISLDVVSGNTLSITNRIDVSAGLDANASLYLGGSVDLQNISIEVSADANASSYLYIDNIVDDSDINRIDVEVDGDNGIAELYLSSDGNDLSINGDISVLASGSTALASLSIDLAGGSLFLDGDDISVVASSVDSSAFANLHDADAYGSVNLISVVANSDDAYASLHIDTLSGDDIVVNTGIYVSAYGDNSSASLYVNGSIDLNSADLVVDADGSGALASIEINSVYGSINDLSVYADNSADASISLDVVSGNTLSITNRIDVSAGLDANASLYLGGSVDLQNISIEVSADANASSYLYIDNIVDDSDINRIDVEVDGDNGIAELYLSSDGNDLSINGDISVLASGSTALASLSIDLAGGSLFLDGDDISVVASSVDSSAFANLHDADAYGSVNLISVVANSDDAYASLHIDTLSGDDIVVNTGIYVSAYGDNSSASLYVNGSIDLNSADLVVDADGSGALASIEINSVYGSINDLSVYADNSADASISLDVVSGNTLSITNRIDVSAGLDANASLYLGGSVDLQNISIEVSADANASSYLYIDNIVDDSDINRIDVEVDGDNGIAELYLSSDGNDLSINGDISVLASGSTALASLSIDLAGGSLFLDGDDISVVASSVDSSAFANLHDADAYGSVNLISVVANSDDAYASLHIDTLSGDDIVVNTGIYVSAYGDNSSASLFVNGSIDFDFADLVMDVSGATASVGLEADLIMGNINSISLFSSMDSNLSANLSIDATVHGEIRLNAKTKGSVEFNVDGSSLSLASGVDVIAEAFDSSASLANHASVLLTMHDIATTINDISVIAGSWDSITSNSFAEASISINDGDTAGVSIDGSIYIAADSQKASAMLDVYDVISDISQIDIQATGNRSFASLYLETSHDIDLLNLTVIDDDAVTNTLGSRINATININESNNAEGVAEHAIHNIYADLGTTDDAQNKIDLTIIQLANSTDDSNETLAFGSIDIDGNQYSSASITFTDDNVVTEEAIIISHSINLDDFDGHFKLALDLKDRDDTTTGTGALNTDNFMEISALDDNDTITFTGAAGNLYADLSDAGTLNDLFADAIAALEDSTPGNQISYYYGAIDATDGYLFFDDDDVGITQVIKMDGWNAEMIALNDNALIENRFDNLITGLSTIDVVGI